MNTKHILWIAVGTGLLLLVPLIAMQFDTGVNWTMSDFIVAGTLLFGAGLAYEFFASKIRTSSNRIVVGVAVLLVLGIVWAHLAVGLFDFLPFAGS